MGTVVVHTLDPAAAARIVAALRRYAYHVLRVDPALAGLVEQQTP